MCPSLLIHGVKKLSIADAPQYAPSIQTPVNGDVAEKVTNLIMPKLTTKKADDFAVVETLPFTHPTASSSSLSLSHHPPQISPPVSRPLHPLLATSSPRHQWQPSPSRAQSPSPHSLSARRTATPAPASNICISPKRPPGSAPHSKNASQQGPRRQRSPSSCVA